MEADIDRFAKIAYETFALAVNGISPLLPICTWEAQPEVLKNIWRLSVQAVLEASAKTDA